MKKNLIWLLSILLLFQNCNNEEKHANRNDLIGDDYRLFESTPAWPLAKAVQSGNLSKIREEVLENKINLDYQESKFGNTLLMLAVNNSQLGSVKTLLELGANPNLRDKHRGTSAVIDASANSDLRYLELLLAHKGDPNAIETRVVKDDDRPIQTALTSAISFSDSSSLKKVSLLVEAGADVNFPKNNNLHTAFPLGIALKQDKMDVALYLLNHRADYNRIMYWTIDGDSVSILQALRKCTLDLGSSEYQKKIEVISFLRSKDLDYYKEPIPAYILKDIKKKYPDSWEEYIKKY